MDKHAFIKKEIIEMSQIHNLTSINIINCFIDGNLSVNYLCSIKDKIIRSAVYECFSIFSDSIFKLTDILYKIIILAQNSKEKGYLVEKKTLHMIKTLFELENGENTIYFNYKLSFIISRRLVFLQGLNFEFDQSNEIELSTLLQQLTTDINAYFLMLKIQHKSSLTINEDHLKSFLIRVLKILSESDVNIELVLKKIDKKTIYFVKSNYKESDIFLHFYSRVLLSPATILCWNNFGLNGGYHYLNKRRIIEPSTYNNYINIIPKLLDFVNKHNNLSLYLDDEAIDIQKNNIVKKLKEDNDVNQNWGEYFSQINNLSHKELDSVLNLESYKKKMKKTYYSKEIDNALEIEKINLLLTDKISIKKKEKLSSKKIYIENLIKEGKLKWDPKIYNKWVQRDFSYIMIIKIYLKFIDFFQNYKDALYYAIYFDFRGRYYPNSLTSPNNGWPFRFIYNFGAPQKNNKINKKINYLLNSDMYINEIKTIENKIGEIKDPEKINALLWLLMSIGSIIIEKKKTITEEEFIKKGLDAYINNVNLDDYLENSEINYYYLIIKDLNKENSPNRYLIKDISGSIFQNASLILGLKDENKLKYLNLDSTEWYDPYSPIIESIRKNVDPRVVIFFIRKTLKKPIMTRYYNSKLFTSFKYFMDEVRKMKEYDDSYFNLLFTEFKKVYNSLKNLEKELLFENSNSDYTDFLEKNSIEEIEYSDFKYNIVSYKLKHKRIDLTVLKKRISITNYIQTKEIYKSKTNNAKIPNIFHGEDSNRARSLLLNFKSSCFTIHDAFAVSPYDVEELIYLANETFGINAKKKFYMNKNNINKKIFSKFIIL